ncbi:MAG: Gfo/Idh/MocA family protein [Thiotrichales bacterium]
MARRIRWGFWGTGAVANDVAADFPLVPEVELYAVASRTLAHAERFAARHGVNKYSSNLEDLLDDPAVDVIYVSTPHERHLEDCLDCLSAGKPVVSEKPFTLNAMQAAQVVDAAREQDLFCMEAMWMRFVPAVVEAKRRVAAGELGAVRFITANFAYPDYFDPHHRLFNLEQGGGALLDRGVYTISLACYLLGLPLSISSSAAIGSTGVDDQSTYQLAFEGGVLADLSASLRVLGRNEAVIMGERGQLRLHAPFYRAHRLSMQQVEPPGPAPLRSEAAEGGIKTRIKATLKQHPAMHQLSRRLDPLRGLLGRGSATFAFPGNGYQFEIAEVGRCLREGLRESPIMPLDETVAIMQIMDAIRGQWGLVYPGE